MDRVVDFLFSFHLFILFPEKLLCFSQHLQQIELFLTVFVNHFKSLEVFFFFPPETLDGCLQFEGDISVFEEEGVDEESSGEIEEVIDFLECE